MLKKVFQFTIIIIAISIKLFSLDIHAIGPYGGKFNCLEISKSNPNIMYAGTRDGGLYKSTNAGENWEYLAFRNNKHIISVSTDCLDHNIVYITLGGLTNQNTYIYSTHKSSDGGITWINLNIIARIVKTSPIENNKVFFGYYDKLFVTKDGGITINETNFYVNSESIKVITPDPIDTSIIYLGTNYAVYKSYNSGLTWTKIKDIIRYSDSPGYVNAISISELNNNIVLVATNYSGLTISSDGGNNWKTKDFGLNINGVICDNIDMNTIYVAHVSGFLKSTDLGDTFTELIDGRFDFSTNSPLGYYLVEESVGEIIKSTDKGQTWVNSNQGISNAAIESIIISNDDNNLFAITSPGNNYQLMKYNNSAWNTILDNYAGEKIYLNEANNQMYMVNGRQDFSISNPPYDSWVRSKAGIPYCLEMDLAINNNDIYMATSSIYDGLDAGIHKSTDLGESWLLSSDGLPEVTRTYFGNSKTTPIDIFCIDINRNNTEDLFAGAYEDLFASCDEGRNWFKIATLDSVYLHDIIIDRNNPDVIYIIAGNPYYYKPKTLYISYDYGLTFNKCNTGLSEDKCMFYDEENEVLYIGGDSGLMKSSDKGLSWECIREDWDNLIINCLYKKDGDHFIYAGTKESGVYKIQLIESSNNIFNSMPNNYMLLQNNPNPFNPITTINYIISEDSNVKLNIYNISGQLLETLVDKYCQSGQYYIKWDASKYVSGIYISRLASRYGILSKKMLLIK